MEMSVEIDKLAQALVQAQKGIKGAVKDAVNPHLKNRYADLTSVFDACKEPLNASGISVLQLNEPSDPQSIRIRTVLLHESGQWISGTIVIPAPKLDPQGYGSAQTYARRYGLMAAVGICPEDDDGNAACAKQAPQQRQQAPAPTGPKLISEGQLKWIHSFFSRNQITDRTVGLEMISDAAGRQVDSSKTLTSAEATKVIDALTKQEAAA